MRQTPDLEPAQALADGPLASPYSFTARTHNTLGKVYFLQKRFYLAAWEFQYASKVMPERSEPFNNLGVVYEAVGKFDKAIEMYEVAYVMDPRNLQTIGNLARSRLRQGDSVQVVQSLLEHLLLYDKRSDWVGWVREQLAMHPEQASNKPNVGRHWTPGGIKRLPRIEAAQLPTRQRTAHWTLCQRRGTITFHK